MALYTKAGLGNSAVLRKSAGLGDSAGLYRMGDSPEGIPITEGLQLFLDARAISGLSDGASIDTWEDLSGNGFNFSMTGSNRPTYDADDGNGQPAVNFASASSQYLSAGNNAAFVIDDNMTMFVVHSRPSVASARMSLFGCQDLNNAFQFELDGKAQKAFEKDTFTSTSVDLDEAAADTVQLTTYARDGASTHINRGNGLPLKQSATSTNSYSADGEKEIGRRAAASQHLNGKIYAFVLFDRTLTSEQIVEMEYYLAERYQAHLDNPFWFEYLGEGAVDTGTIYMQGAAFDGTNHWTTSGNSGTGTVKKWLRTASDTYSLVATYDVSSDMPASFEQVNGIDFYNGSIWLGCNNHNATPAQGCVLEFDPSDMSLLSTNYTEGYWCEGGAWFNNEYFAIHHDTLRVSRYDSSWNFQGSFPRADRGHPDPTVSISQSGMWLSHAGEDWFICPNHQDSGSLTSTDPSLANYCEIDRWDGNGFDKGYRVPLGVIDNQTLGSVKMGQGMNWDTSTPGLNKDIIAARRNSTGSLVRMRLRRRRGSSAWEGGADSEVTVPNDVFLTDPDGNNFVVSPNLANYLTDPT